MKIEGMLYARVRVTFFLGGSVLKLNGGPQSKRNHLFYCIVLLRSKIVLEPRCPFEDWLPAQSVRQAQIEKNRDYKYFYLTKH